VASKEVSDLLERRTELFLLLLVAIIAYAGFSLVSLTSNQPVETGLKMASLLLALFIALHIANRLFARNADPILLPLCAFLTELGLIMICRLKPELGVAQSIWILAGVSAAILVLAVLHNYSGLKEYKYTWVILGILLLFAPVFVGVQRGGSRLWIDLGPISFQPAEIAKILFVLFLAAYLVEKRELLSISTKRVFGVWLPEPKYFGPVVVMWLVSLIILILERDLGTSLLFFGLFLAMLYIATGRPIYVILGTTLFAIGASVCYYLFSHVQTRVDIWLNPWIDASGKGYQVVQSLFAIAGGGLTGTGIGIGHPGIIPEVQTDFIFSAIAEELGLLGGIAVVLVYLLFVSRGLKIALNTKNEFGALVAAGLSCVFALQSFTIMAGVTKLVPLTGVTLPFVSYGGSSILMNFILLAALLIISSKSGDEHA
jgi:cell division protein FtsW (lipid II flippase)